MHGIGATPRKPRASCRAAGWQPAMSASRRPRPDRHHRSQKDLIVNDKGDNVAPQKVEGMLTLQPEIAQAMVFGDRRPYLVGLLVPDPEFAGAADLQQRLAKAVDRVNAELSVVEKVRRFIVADGPFSIENEQMTPSMKIRAMS